MVGSRQQRLPARLGVVLAATPVVLWSAVPRRGFAGLVGGRLLPAVLATGHGTALHHRTHEGTPRCVGVGASKIVKASGVGPRSRPAGAATLSLCGAGFAASRRFSSSSIAAKIWGLFGGGGAVATEAGPGGTIYDFTVKDIDLREVSLKEYEGKVALIVNVASK
eukprot:TRINITY_DN12069_c1_g1_i1.p1 TRINITY_DN12069_c1_g1~~TRINITY_DN12069_c1_g1_i1.p1  ORF type:complete len:165 (+),score=26.34 TRINITY_DN12069_c1_g1_i1:66-560(+)